MTEELKDQVKKIMTEYPEFEAGMARFAKILRQCKEHIESTGSKVVYISLAGSHNYGFSSDDSDYDMHCCHVMPTAELFKFDAETKDIRTSFEVDGKEIQLVSYEVQKLLTLLMKNNCNILEDVTNTNCLVCDREIKDILDGLVKGSMSKAVYNSFNGVATENYKKFIGSQNPHYKNKASKKYLYILRAYMAGIHVLKTGNIVSNIHELKKEFNSEIIDLLIEKKISGKDLGVFGMKAGDEEIEKYKKLLEEARINSHLPQTPLNFEEFEKLLYVIRIRSLQDVIKTS